MSFEEAQEYASNRGIDIPWNDGDIFIDEREITRTVGNVLRWADDSMIVDKNEEKQWRQERKKAFNEIRACAQKMRSLYERFILPDLIGSMKTKEGKFDVCKYDDNMRDANELVRLMLWHWEKCFASYENVDKVFGFYESLSGSGIFTKEEIEKFKIK